MKGEALGWFVGAVEGNRLVRKGTSCVRVQHVCMFVCEGSIAEHVVDNFLMVWLVQHIFYLLS